MNLIEIADDLKNLPDQYLMQEIQAPSGNFPTYLIVTELGRRKRMRDKVAKDMPTQTVAEELATPPQPQMPPQMAPQGMPPQAGLMAMPQAQTELAAQDAMGTTPPEMMMPTQQMAGGGMVSFKQGGDVVHSFSQGDFINLPIYREPSSGPAGSMGELFSNMVPSMRTLSDVERRIDPVTGRPITLGEYLRLQDERRVAAARNQVPAAVAPVVAQAAPTAAPGAAPSAAPAPAPSAAPSDRAAVAPIAFNPASSVLPAALTSREVQDARTRGLAEYEQAVPDRLTPFLQEAITKREGELGGRRDSNINEALIQAGLGMMGSKSPYFLQGVSEGGLSGLKLYREGAKDIRQSEDALLASQAKLVEAQTLRDDRKFKAAEDAEKRAYELNKYGMDRANTESAIALRNVQADIAARKAPAEIEETQARAAYYRDRPAGLDKTIATPDQIAQARIRAMTDLAANDIKKPNQAQIDAAVDAILAQSGLRRVGGGITQLPAAIDRGTI